MSDLNFDSLFGDAEIDFECPECGHKLTISLNDIGSSIKCPGCSVAINLEKDDSFDDERDSINNSLEELEDTLNNFGK